jgi:hypothetical protein
VHLSPEALNHYGAHPHKKERYEMNLRELLGFMNVQDEFEDWYDDGNYDPIEPWQSIWERNDEAINKIQHLTLTQWCLNAEFDDLFGNEFRWENYLFTTLDYNLRKLKTVTIIDDVFLKYHSLACQRAGAVQYRGLEKVTVRMQEDMSHFDEL